MRSWATIGLLGLLGAASCAPDAVLVESEPGGSGGQAGMAGGEGGAGGSDGGAAPICLQPYTNVPKGEYEIRVRTIDANGVAQPMPRPFQKSGGNAIQKMPLTVEG